MPPPEQPDNPHLQVGVKSALPPAAAELVTEDDTVDSPRDHDPHCDALCNSQDLLTFAQQVFEYSNNGFFEWHVPTNRFRYSKSFERMLGYGPDELDLSETSISAHIQSDDYRQLVRALAASARKGANLELQLRLYNKQGTLRWYQVQLVPYSFSSSGATKVALGCVSDVHNLKSAQPERGNASDLETWMTAAIRDLLVDEKPGSIGRCLNNLCQQFDIDLALVREVRNHGDHFYLVDTGQHPTQSAAYELESLTDRDNLPFDVESFLQGKAYVVHDVQNDPSLTAEMKSKFINNIRSFAAIPIYYHGQLDYFISVLRYTTSRPWSADCLRAVELMGDAMALVAARQRITQELSRNEERFQHAMEATQDGIWDWDIANGQFTVTPTFLYMLGYNEEYLPLDVEKINKLFFPPTTIDSFFDCNNAFNSKTLGRFEIELPMRHQTGRNVWVSIVGKHVDWDENGNPTRCVGENKDISVQKFNLQQLLLKSGWGMKNHLKLSLKANDVGSMLRAMSQNLASADAEQVDKSYLETISQQLSQAATDLSAEHLSPAGVSPEDKVIRSWLTELENNTPDSQQRSLKNWLCNDCEELRKFAAKNHVEFNTDYPEELIQLCYQPNNLLYRSLSELTRLLIAHQQNTQLTLSVSVLKHTDSKTLVRFTWHCDKHLEAFSGLSGVTELGSSGCTDQAEQQQDEALKSDFLRCLDPFVLLNTEFNTYSNEYQGMNIVATMPIHRQPTQGEHSDQCDINPKPSATENRKPVASPEGKPQPAGGDNNADVFTNTTVLLAEDNLVNQKVAVGMLQRKGMEVIVANNGQEAVDILLQKNGDYFDLVLMDMDMPVLDGYDATRAIRDNSRLSHLPVIAVTAHTAEEDRQRSFAAGVIEHIGKPLKPEALYNVMANVLRQQHYNGS